jgi:hypothetical protein
MMMVLPTLVKGELGERRDVDDILGQDKLELCILHFEKLCLTMNELGSCFFPPLPTGPKLLFFFTGADNVVT